jgi:hypothetical protein
MTSRFRPAKDRMVTGLLRQVDRHGTSLNRGAISAASETIRGWCQAEELSATCVEISITVLKHGLCLS